MTTLHIDLETRSPVDLRKRGVYVYAEHPATSVTCACYAFDDGPIHLWKRGEPCPPAIYQHVTNGGEIAAFNASFERIVWWAVLCPQGWPRPKIEQFRCVMVKAMAMSLPGKLELAAPALGLTELKDAQGSRLAIQMSKPRKSRPDGTYAWWDDEDRLNKLYAYCKQDGVVEREIDNRTVPLKDSEQRLWCLDQRINDRGVQVDIALCHAARKVVAQATEKLDAEMNAVTGGEVQAVSQVQRLKQWLKTRGVDAESVGKDAMVDLLGNDTLPDDCRRALELRKEGGKASVAKIDALLACVNRDGRARGLLQFHGAGTGRWAGRRVQPQNLTRPVMEHPEDAIPLIMTGSADAVEMVFDSPLQVVSDCIRSMLCGGV